MSTSCVPCVSAAVILTGVSLLGGSATGHARTRVPDGRLEVRHLAEVAGGPNLLPGARIKPSTTGKYRLQVKPGAPGPQPIIEFLDVRTGKPVPESVVLKNAPIVLTERDLKRKQVAEARGNTPPRLTLELTDAAVTRFRQFTSRNIGAILAVAVDGKILATPMITAPNTDGKLVIPTAVPRGPRSATRVRGLS